MAGEIVSPPNDEKDNACAVVASTDVLYAPASINFIVVPPDLGTGGGGSGGTKSYSFVS